MSSAERDAVIRRLRKVLALARHGVGGERDNAQSQLDAMLRRHGLTLADLLSESEERTFVEFEVDGDLEGRLLRQVIAMVTDCAEVETFHVKRKKHIKAFKLTAAQYATAKLAFSVTRRALAEEVEGTFKAFVQVNGLFPATQDDDQQAPSPLDEAELLRMLQRMQLMNKTLLLPGIEQQPANSQT